MGNIQNCTQNCFIWFKGYNQKITKLRQQYRCRYKNTIFFRNCIDFVQTLHNTNTNIDNNYQVLNLKGSLIDSIHYQQDSISNMNGSRKSSKGDQYTNYIEQQNNNSKEKDSKHNTKLPQRLSSMNQYQKKQLITDLIKKSYIFLDISDIFSEKEETHSYQNQIKHKIFQNDQSMMTQSFFSSAAVDNLTDSLRKFDLQTMYKLETYVKMCQQIKEIFENQNYNEHGNAFGHLLLTMKSKLIQHYNSEQNKNIEQLFKNTRILINILQVTVDIIFDLHIYQYEHPNNKNKNSKQFLVDSEILHSQQENAIHFLNQTNLYTLMSCILFDDNNFHQFFHQSITDKFRNKLNIYKQRTVMTDQTMASIVLGHDQVMHNYFQPTIANLFNSKIQQKNYFQKTIKMYNKLSSKLEPVLKLKLLAELQKQFLREMKKLCEIKNVQMIYDRSISQYMATWLLNRDKIIGQQNIVSIILAYAFVHNTYRLGAKGSTILSFVENVQKILDWPIPSQ